MKDHLTSILLTVAGASYGYNVLTDLALVGNVILTYISIISLIIVIIINIPKARKVLKVLFKKK